MQFASIFKGLGLISIVITLGLLVPTLYSYFDGTNDLNAFIISLIICTATGIVLLSIPKSKHALKFRDGYALVAFGWLSAGLFGALPYYFSDATPYFTDAYFESISGFTTTGASIFSDIEALTPAILLWRSMTQWFGGMGIIVLSIAVLPYLDIGGMSIFQAEVPGPTAEKLTPRIQDTAKFLWFVYFLFTVILTAFLWAAGMTVFEAINHSFTTMSTGGFSTNNSSIAGFHSPVIEWILITFMVIAGINFALHYRYLFKGLKFKSYFEDSEFIFYMALVASSILIVSVVILLKQGGGVEQAIRDASFTIVSIMTTTGFGTADYLLWPVFCQLVLLFLMIIGGSAGSTSGGIKTVRAMLVVKYMYTEMLKLLHPTLIRTVKIRKVTVERSVLASILSFIFMYLAVMGISILLVSLETNDIVTAIGSVVASLGNIGPGFGTVGPTSNYAHLGQFTKWILSIDMAMGRLEILTILILFLPQAWKK